MPNRQPYNPTKRTEQDLSNNAWDYEFDLPLVEPTEYDGRGFQRKQSDQMAMKITEAGELTYIALAAPGTLENEAKWQVKRIDETAGLLMDWAGGSPAFTHVATDLTALSYS